MNEPIRQSSYEPATATNRGISQPMNEATHQGSRGRVGELGGRIGRSGRAAGAVGRAIGDGGQPGSPRWFGGAGGRRGMLQGALAARLIF